MKALAAMPAADALELARRSSGGRAALNMTHMLFQTTLREEPPTVLALRIFRAFSASHLSLSDDQPFLHRTSCEENRRRACAFDQNGSRKCAHIKRMSAEASHFYRADLGQLDKSSERIFQAWVDSQRHKHVLVKEDDGTVVLFAEREEERQKKSHMAALRTTISNWKIPVQLPPGFLRLLSETEFRAAMASSQVEPPIAEPTAIESSFTVRPPPPASYDMEQVVPSLSQDFDKRGCEMLAALVAA